MPSPKPLPGPGSVPQSRVYAHSGDVLYQIDTQTLGAVRIGAMNGLGASSGFEFKPQQTYQFVASQWVASQA